MEYLTQACPHIVERILSNLDFKNLLNMRLVSRNIKELVDARHALWTEGISSLHVAARFDQHDDAQKIISSGVKIDKPLLTDKRGQGLWIPSYFLKFATPLHIAAYHHSNRVLQLLVDSDADIDAQAYHVKSALEFAIEGDNADGLRILIAGGASIKGLLHTCACLGRTHLIEILLNHGANLEEKDHQGSTALNTACHRGFFHLASFLIERGATLDVADEMDQTPLLGACDGSHLTIVTALLAAGASPDPFLPAERSMTNNFGGISPLYIAFRQEDTEIFSLLLRSGARTDLDPYSGRPGGGLLHSMLDHYRFHINDQKGIQMFHQVVKSGIDLTFQNYDGTVLHKCVRIIVGHAADKVANYIELIQLFLRHGADKSIRNNADQTARDLLIALINRPDLTMFGICHSPTFVRQLSLLRRML